MRKQRWLTLEEACKYTGKDKSSLQNLIISKCVIAKRVKGKDTDEWIVRQSDCNQIRETNDTSENSEYFEKPVSKPASNTILDMGKWTSKKAEIIVENLTNFEASEKNTSDEITCIFKEALGSSLESFEEQVLEPLKELQFRTEEVSRQIASKDRELRNKLEAVIEENQMLIDELIHQKSQKDEDDKEEETFSPVSDSCNTNNSLNSLRTRIKEMRRMRELALEEERKTGRIPGEIELKKKLKQEREALWMQFQREEAIWLEKLESRSYKSSWWRRILGF